MTDTQEIVIRTAHRTPAGEPLGDPTETRWLVNVDSRRSTNPVTVLINDDPFVIDVPTDRCPFELVVTLTAHPTARRVTTIERDADGEIVAAIAEDYPVPPPAPSDAPAGISFARSLNVRAGRA